MRKFAICLAGLVIVAMMLIPPWVQKLTVTFPVVGTGGRQWKTADRSRP